MQMKKLTKNLQNLHPTNTLHIDPPPTNEADKDKVGNCLSFGLLNANFYKKIHVLMHRTLCFARPSLHHKINLFVLRRLLF